MQATVISCLAVLAVVSQSANPIPKDELEYQQQTFRQWWGQDLVLSFADLPADGRVPEFRVPYSGHDYPDRGGGTMQAMMKYDRAFHGNQRLATEWERHDVGNHRGPRGAAGYTPPPVRRGGLIDRIRTAAARGRTPSWYGHCNGWTAAAIRHAEPQLNVTRNGVVFTPADIKGMLAEIYMYTDTEFLGGVSQVIHPAVMHVVLANWLGRGEHPIGMESAIGEVVINYPIYEYKSTITRHSENVVEVALTATYAMNTNYETNERTRYHKQAFYHYRLDLDNDGKVVGGRYYSDSNQIDMLWAPLQPIQGGQKGNERGNPHVNIKEVLAIWRESVPENIRQQWLNIDPTVEDRIELGEPAANTTATLAEGTEEKKPDDEKPVSSGDTPVARNNNENGSDLP